MQRRLEEGGTITVPVPLHREIRRGTLLSIVRQAGLETKPSPDRGLGFRQRIDPAQLDRDESPDLLLW